MDIAQIRDAAASWCSSGKESEICAGKAETWLLGTSLSLPSLPSLSKQYVYTI